MPATRYRDLQPRSLIDVGARATPTGAASAQQALADSFSSFSRAASEAGGLAQEFAANRAAKTGEQEGAAGTPKFKKGFGALTTVGRAYNSAAETAYVAKVHTDINDTMTRLEQDSEADLAGFSEKAKSYSDSLLAEVPEEMRPVIGHVLTARSLAGQDKVRDQQKSKERTQTYADYLTSVPAIVNNTLAAAKHLPSEQADAALTVAVHDNEARLAELVKDNVVDADSAVKLSAQFHTALDKGLVSARTDPAIEQLSNLARDDVQLGDAALAAIENRDDLSFDDKTEIRKGYEKQRNLLAFERSRQFAEQSGDFAKRLAGGAHGQDTEHENLALYKQAAISVDEYQSNQSTIQRNADKNAEDAVDMTAVLEAMNGGRGLDPTNTKQRKVLDKVFKAGAGMAGMEQGDPRWQASAINIAKRTNVLPESAQAWARVNMMSGDPNQVAQGATFFARAQEANPAAWDYDADPKIAAFAEQMNANLSAGVVTERAFEMAHKNVYEQTDYQRQELAKRYRDDKVAKDNSDTLRGSLNGDSEFDHSFLGMGGAPTPTLAMQADYNGAVERMYSYVNGDIGQARKLAYDSIKSRYGYTQMNGEPEIIKYAPEKMYPGLTPEIIRNDVANTIAGLSGSSAALEKPAGLRTPGNLDPWNRKVLKNGDGSVSTTSSMSIGTDQGETLIPTVVDGVRLSKEDAIKHFRDTGEHLGVFDTPEHADTFAEALHNEQARRMGLGLDPAKVRLTAVPATERTKGRVWLLQAPDEYGAYDVVRDEKNQPVLYQLPLGNDFNAARDRLNAAKVADAERKRQEALQFAQRQGTLDQQDFAKRR